MRPDTCSLSAEVTAMTKKDDSVDTSRRALGAFVFGAAGASLLQGCDAPKGGVGSVAQALDAGTPANCPVDPSIDYASCIGVSPTNTAAQNTAALNAYFANIGVTVTPHRVLLFDEVGTYDLDRGILVPPAMELRGRGAQGTLLRCSGAGSESFFIGPKNPGRITLRQLGLVGGDDANSTVDFVVQMRGTPITGGCNPGGAASGGTLVLEDVDVFCGAKASIYGYGSSVIFKSVRVLGILPNTLVHGVLLEGCSESYLENVAVSSVGSAGVGFRFRGCSASGEDSLYTEMPGGGIASIANGQRATVVGAKVGGVASGGCGVRFESVHHSDIHGLTIEGGNLEMLKICRGIAVHGVRIVAGDVVFDDSHGCRVTGVMQRGVVGDANVYHRGIGKRCHAIVFPESQAEAGGGWWLRVIQIWEHGGQTWSGFGRADGALLSETGHPPEELAFQMMNHGDVVWNARIGTDADAPAGWRFKKIGPGNSVWIAF
ncbi:MAG: hypothetical protein AAGE52_28315 [Myxococcota bacterium]